MKNLFLSVFLLLKVQLLCIAQWSGVIKDLSGKPIQDAIIMNLRSQEHTHSDSYGKFTDNKVKSGDSIRISLMGYHSKTIFFDQDISKTIEIILQENPVVLSEIYVSEPVHYNLQRIDVKMNPVQNSQELLRIVPGLFIAQHAGGGKAEQIFLRGFDIDHGTDVNLSVDEILPVNMVSHAHGQGYSDLHFVIPEVIQNVEFEKGSYNAAKGNFATAGSVNFTLKDHIHQNNIGFEKGMFNYNRAFAMIKLFQSSNFFNYIAGEYITSDGYFKSKQDFNKVNLLGRFKYKLSDVSELKFTATYFKSRWLASGQIPQREVDAGRLDRYGAIDDTEGGITGRTNFLLQYSFFNKVNRNLKCRAFYSDYNFELYSNFTFFLNDFIHGDQIKQKEKRKIYGLEISYENRKHNWWYQAALGSKSNHVDDIELSHTFMRSATIEQKALGDSKETQYYSYIKAFLEKNKWLLQTGIRLDVFQLNYLNKLDPNQSVTIKTKPILNPKLNLNYNVNKNIQIYNKNGMGFHSNDIRLLVQNSDKDIITQSINSDLGVQWKPINNTYFHAAYWFILMEDELVYVGDEAIVESVGKTRRHGIEFGFRTELGKYVDVFSDVSYTLARSIEVENDANFLALASKWTSTGGINFQHWRRLSAGIKYRFLGDRPANEDYSIVAKGYTVVDAHLNYKFKNITFSAIIDNVLNTNWNEAQFATLSKLRSEVVPVEEIHFTPGTPLNIRFKVLLSF